MAWRFILSATGIGTISYVIGYEHGRERTLTAFSTIDYTQRYWNHANQDIGWIAKQNRVYCLDIDVWKELDDHLDDEGRRLLTNYIESLRMNTRKSSHRFQ